MADVTNAEAIRFVNEVIRPMAERLRALTHLVESADTQWQNGIGTLMTADLAGNIMDGREAEGVSRLTANDVVLLMAQVETIKTQLTGVGVQSVIAKPCVRPLNVES